MWVLNLAILIGVNLNFTSEGYMQSILLIGLDYKINLNKSKRDKIVYVTW